MILSAALLYNSVFMMGYRDGSLPSGEGVTFPTVVDQIYARIGNPFSFPIGAYVSWRYDVPISSYDQLRGRTYNNITVDVGAPGDERFIGHGWAGRESDPHSSFRWANRETSTLLVPLTTDVDDYQLDLEWAPFEAPGLPVQVVGIEVNDRPLPAVALRPGLQTDSVRIPRSLLRRNLNQLRFRYTYVRSPRDLQVSDDSRPLAVRFATIRLTRLLPPEP
jgi:hypothetical protein